MPFAHFFSLISDNLLPIVAKGGYAFLFLVTTLEGLPLVGMLVPGHVSIILGGFLARIGTLDLTLVTLLAIAGAILGDALGFLVGRRYGIKFIDRLRPYFFVSDAHLEKARALLAKHTGKAMLIGRFSPVTRALMPFLVGASHTTQGRFWFFNILGAVSWAVSSVAIGYAFGSGYHAAAGIFGKGVVFAIILAALIIWGYRFVNLRFHLFRRYELFTLGLNILSLWVLAKTIQDAASRTSFMSNFDVYVSLFMEQHVTPFWSEIALVLTSIGSTWVTAIVSLVIGLIFLLRNRLRSGAIMLLSTGGTALAIGVMKFYFLRARPANALYLLSDPSFPSGHAAMAATFFLTLSYLLLPRIHSWIKREFLIVVAALAVFVIGLSRVVLNVHWVADVLAGWALGIFVSTSSILLVKYLAIWFRKVDK